MKRHQKRELLVPVFGAITTVMLALSSLVLLVAMLWGIQGWLAAQPGPSPPTPTKVEAPPKDPQAQYDTLKERMETLKAKLDAAADKQQSAERLLSLELTLTSLYALALGLSSYFSLQRILSTSKEELEKLGRQLQDKYPELAGLHERLFVILNQSLKQTKETIPLARDWTTAYEYYSEREKQRFLLAESTVNGMELFGLGESAHSRSQVFDFYHSLGKFYGGKFNFAKTIENRGDWERGRLYFEKAENLAVEHSDISKASKAKMAKDFGVFFTLIERVAPEEWYKGDYASRAEAKFRESLSWNPNEAGALFGWSWILSNNGHHKAAIEKVTQVIKLKNWDEVERKKILPFAFSNRAVFLVRAGDPAKHDDALRDLQCSSKLALEFGLEKEWNDDFYLSLGSPAGDLLPLLSTHGEAIDALLDRMS